MSWNGGFLNRNRIPFGLGFFGEEEEAAYNIPTSPVIPPVLPQVGAGPAMDPMSSMGMDWEKIFAELSNRDYNSPEDYQQADDLARQMKRDAISLALANANVLEGGKIAVQGRMAANQAYRDEVQRLKKERMDQEVRGLGMTSSMVNIQHNMAILDKMRKDEAKKDGLNAVFASSAPSLAGEAERLISSAASKKTIDESTASALRSELGAAMKIVGADPEEGMKLISGILGKASVAAGRDFEDKRLMAQAVTKSIYEAWPDVYEDGQINEERLNQHLREQRSLSRLNIEGASLRNEHQQIQNNMLKGWIESGGPASGYGPPSMSWSGGRSKSSRSSSGGALSAYGLKEIDDYWLERVNDLQSGTYAPTSKDIVSPYRWGEAARKLVDLSQPAGKDNPGIVAIPVDAYVGSGESKFDQLSRKQEIGLLVGSGRGQLSSDGKTLFMEEGKAVELGNSLTAIDMLKEAEKRSYAANAANRFEGQIKAWLADESSRKALSGEDHARLLRALHEEGVNSPTVISFVYGMMIKSPGDAQAIFSGRAIAKPTIGKGGKP